MPQAEQILYNNHPDKDSLHDHIVTSIVYRAEEISEKVILFEKPNYNSLDRRIDSILTSKTWGIPVMLALLGLVFWIQLRVPIILLRL